MRDAALWRRIPGPGVGHLAAVAVCLTVLVSSPEVRANWFSKIVREAGEAGGTAGARLGLGALDNAALHIRSIPKGAVDGLALAAHATPEGHWKFVNRPGDVYTAGTPDEMGRVVAALAPDLASNKPKLALYLSEDTVFNARAALKELPPDAALHVVVGKASYPLLRKALGGGERLFAEVRPNVALALDERRAVDEAFFQLSRLIEKARIRVLALSPGGPDSLKSVPRYDPATKSALVDEIDPISLGQALGSLRGQTAVVAGRVEAGQLKFKSSGGAEGQIPLAELESAAARADVNLVVLSSSLSSQPGGRNWLWQRVAVDGLDDALKRTTYVDFLYALSSRRGPLLVEAQAASNGRAVMRAVPLTSEASVPLSSALGEFMADVASHVTGNVVTNAIELSTRSEERQRELDARFIPGIPSLVQIGYLACLVAGIAGLPFSRAWWSRIWPVELRSEYAGAMGFWAARVVRMAVFVMVFLPLVGVPAFLASAAAQLWTILAAPWRFVRWLGRIYSGRDSPA